MFRVISAILLFVLICPLMLRAEDLPLPPNISEVREGLWNAMRLGYRAVNLRVEQRQETATGFESLWIGNVPDVALNVSSVSLSFYPAIKDKASLPFSLEVRREKKGIVVRHSKPRKKKERGGLRFPREGDSSFLGMLDGTPPVAVLSAMTADRRVEIVAVCPRAFGPVPSGDKGTVLLDHENRLRDVWGVVDGALSASFVSGYGQGLIEMSLSVTPNVAQPVLHFDRVLGKDPEAQLLYTASSEPFSSTLIGESGTVPVGISYSLVQKNAAGYVKSSIFESRVLVSHARLPDGVRFQTKKLYYDVGPGYCVEILYFDAQRDVYSRLEAEEQPEAQPES